MAPEVLGIIGFIVLFALLAIGMPIGFALIIIAFAGMSAAIGLGPALGTLASAPYSIVSSYMYCTLPLYVLMGAFIFEAGLTTEMYTAAYNWLGRVRGGLAIATIGACAGFAACTGSSSASVGMMTLMALPEMEKHGYDQKLSTGTIAAGCTLGVLIPPSIPFVVYGLFAEVSIGKLFIAGIIPGIILVALFSAIIFIWASIDPKSAPPAQKTSWKEKFVCLKDLWAPVLLIIIVLGGIWGGVFTPVEAAGIGAVGALLICIFRKKLTKQSFSNSIMDTIKISGMMFIIMIGAIMFNSFIALTQIPAILSNYIISLEVSPVAVLIILLAFYAIGGCVMDMFGLIMLTLPIFIPILISSGIDLLLFGVLSTIMIEMALITPPIGLNVFILGGMATNVPMYNIFKGSVPFLFAIVALLALVIIFPQIALFLPGTMIK